MSRIPLGKREDLRLELKGREALKSPEDIAREVVAMLNADREAIPRELDRDSGRLVLPE